MFFIGKLPLALVLFVDALLFLGGLWLYRRKKGESGKAGWHVLPAYFLQLFLLLLVLPLRPEGFVIHLSGPGVAKAKIIPVIDGKAAYAKQQVLDVGRQRDALPPVYLLHFKNAPRDFLVDFGEHHDGLAVSQIEFFTTFLSHPIPIIQIHGSATNDFIRPLHASQGESTAETAAKGHLRSVTPHDVFLLQMADKLADYPIWPELIRRAVLWASLSTLVAALVLLLPRTASLALRHARNQQRTVISATAYFGFSAFIISLSLLTVLVIAEFGFRFLTRDVLSTAARSSYFYNRSYKLFANELNSHKFRGKDFQWSADRKCRIVVMGDSITYGQGVYPHTLRYTELAEQRLNAAYPDTAFEVINLGICGQNVPDHIRFLHFVRQLHPDFILYQWFINDMDFMSSPADMMPPRLVKSRYADEELNNHSALYFLVQKGWQQLCVKNGRVKSYDRHIVDLLGDESAPAARTANTRLSELIDGIKAIGKPGAVVLFPHAAFPIDRHPFAFMHERVARICRQMDIPCLDLRQDYAPYDNRLPALWANKYDPHPGPLAQDIAAKSIISRFGAIWHKQAQEKLTGKHG